MDAEISRRGPVRLAGHQVPFQQALAMGVALGRRQACEAAAQRGHLISSRSSAGPAWRCARALDEREQLARQADHGAVDGSYRNGARCWGDSASKRSRQRSCNDSGSVEKCAPVWIARLRVSGSIAPRHRSVPVARASAAIPGFPIAPGCHAVAPAPPATARPRHGRGHAGAHAAPSAGAAQALEWRQRSRTASESATVAA